MSDSAIPHIIVLGAGVVGLTTAIKIQEEKGYRVTIIADVFPDNPRHSMYTSIWAGAQQVSTSEPDIPQLAEWQRETYHEMMKLAAPGTPSAHCFKHCSNLAFFRDLVRLENHPSDFYPDFKQMSKDELVPGFVAGVSFSALTIDTQVYLPYLLERFTKQGGHIVRGTVDHISQVIEGGTTLFSPTLPPSPPDAIVTCPGLSARFLGGIEDKAMYPLRGQTVILKAPWVHDMPVFASPDGNPTYIIPRQSGNIVVGGTFHRDDWYPKPRPEITRAILERAVKLWPQLAPPEIRAIRTPTADDLVPLIVEEAVGLRPGRDGGVRLEVEWMNTVVSEKKVPVVHHYGHSYFGYQSSWGSASAALKVLDEALKSR